MSSTVKPEPKVKVLEVSVPYLSFKMLSESTCAELVPPSVSTVPATKLASNLTLPPLTEPLIASITLFCKLTIFELAMVPVQFAPLAKLMVLALAVPVVANFVVPLTKLVTPLPVIVAPETNSVSPNKLTVAVLFNSEVDSKISPSNVAVPLFTTFLP